MGNCTSALRDVMNANNSSAATTTKDWADWSDNVVVSRRYRISSILGTGAFSEVYAAYDKQLHRNVALKVVHLSRPSLKPVVKAIIKREAKVLQKVGGLPGVVRVTHVEEDARHLFIALELMKSELFMEILELPSFKESEAAALFYKIVIAVDAIHDRGFLHRDIKPENILASVTLLKQPPPTPDAHLYAKCHETWIAPKLIDFGMADTMIGSDGDSMRGLVGSPGFMAPEICGPGDRIHTPAMDIYSLGVLLFMLVTATVPHAEQVCHDLTYHDIPFHRAKNATHPDFVRMSTNLQDLVARMLELDAKKRITMAEIKAHPWFAPGGASEEEIALAHYGEQLKRSNTSRRVGNLAHVRTGDCLETTTQTDQHSRGSPRKKSVARLRGQKEDRLGAGAEGGMSMSGLVLTTNTSMVRGESPPPLPPITEGDAGSEHQDEPSGGT